MIVTKAVIYAAGAALLASLAWGGVQCSQKQAARLDASRAQTALERFRVQVAEAAQKAEADARAAERRFTQDMADIGSTHEEDRTAAEAVPAAVVADLRAGNRRLQNHWAECATSRAAETAAAAAERDAAAARREADIGNLVRVGRDADDQLRACQQVVLADRAIPAGELP